MNARTTVEVFDLLKRFRVRRPPGPGLLSRVRSVFAPEHDEVVAVAGLSFLIRRGERVSFIGLNGAGKSTTLKVLSGVLCPDAGEVLVLGKRPWRDRYELGFRIGAVFGQRSQLFYQLTPRQSFELLSRVYELSRLRYAARLAELARAFELASLLDKPVRTLSLGERMRCELAASLLHDPEVLFLDEPTIGLDVSAKAAIRELLRLQSERDGATLLLTSHDTGDIERVSERVIVIHHGRLLLDGPVAALRRGYLGKRRVVTVTEAAELELSLPGVRCVSSAEHRTAFELDARATPLGALVDAVSRRTVLCDLEVEDPPLDEVIRALYAGAERSQAS